MPKKVRVILSTVIATVALGQSKPEEPVNTTVCELVQAPARFNGRMVQVRAELKSGFEFGGLVQGDCWLLPAEDGFPELENRTGYYAFVKSFEDLDHPDRLAWKPIHLPPKIHLIEDSAFRELQKYSSRKWKRSDGSVCVECSLYSITVTVTGRFDHVESNLMAIRSAPGQKPMPYGAGFGHLRASRTRLVWRTVSDVVATPIDAAIYEKRK